MNQIQEESNQHSLLFIQFEEDRPMTRTYLDFRSMSDCLDGIVQIYEQHLARLKAGKRAGENEKLAYKMEDLCRYIDGLADMSCMIFHDVQKVYIPHDRQWIKSKIYLSLKRAAKVVEP